MEIPKNIEAYTFAPGTKMVAGIACRKHRALKSVSLPDGLKTIGDAAFSFCTKLKKITIPASVEHIGVAAFCKSGVEEVKFLGIPASIDNAVFSGCDSLRKILVPVGMKQKMTEVLKEKQSIIEQTVSTTNPVQTDLFSVKVTKRVNFTYNYHDFSWGVGDNVSLDELFCGPTVLTGDPSYQFRRKALFIFMSDQIANKLLVNRTYEVPANVNFFLRKYREKYGTRSPRIFIFTCNDGQNAKVYDEVRFIEANKNTITVKSNLDNEDRRRYK